MSSSATQDPGGFADRTSSGRRVVDWILAGMLVLIGSAVIAMGGLLFSVADRDTIADLIADERIESEVITQADLADILFAGSWWGGIGVMLAGGVMVLVGIVFAAGRVRIDRAEGDSEPPTLFANGLLGASITSLTTFIPFSSVLGGGVAGYLQTDDSWGGAMAGALAGALLAIPITIISVMILVGLAAEGYAAWALLGTITLLFGTAFAIGLSAVGGAVGSYLRNRE